MSPQEIASSALADLQEHEDEHSADYWVGYLQTVLTKIAEQ